MSYDATDWAFKQPVSDASAKLVLLAICHHADKDGKAFPSLSRISELTGLAKRTISRKVAMLVEAGLITAEERTRPNGSHTSTLYSVDLNAAEGAIVTRTPPIVTETPPYSHSVTPIINHNNKSDKSSSSVKAVPKEDEKEKKPMDWTDFAKSVS